MQLTLIELPGTFAVCQLAKDQARPTPGPDDDLFALLEDKTGVTVVCMERSLPVEAEVERDWRALVIQGAFDFDTTGVLLSVARPLADASIGIFVLSTFETDYVLIKSHNIVEARQALRAAGHRLLRPSKRN